MRVDLRGSDARVAQGLLHGAYVGGAEESGRERVAESVRCDAVVTYVVGDVFDGSLDGAWVDGRSVVSAGESEVPRR